MIAKHRHPDTNFCSHRIVWILLLFRLNFNGHIVAGSSSALYCQRVSLAMGLLHDGHGQVIEGILTSLLDRRDFGIEGVGINCLVMGVQSSAASACRARGHSQAAAVHHRQRYDS
jgi:hypothetical protein